MAPATYNWIAVIDDHTVANNDNASVTGLVSGTPTEFVWKFGDFNNRKGVPLVVKDGNGTTVTFTMSGNGFGSVLGGTTLANDNLVVDGANSGSTVRIATSGPTTTMTSVNVLQSIGSFVAPSVNFTGTITQNGANEFIVLNNIHSSASPIDLGTITNITTATNLTSSTVVNWFKFTLPSTGDANSSVQFAYTGPAGGLKLALYRDPAHSGAIAYGVDATNLETISLNGLAAGTYYVRVYGYGVYAYTAQVTPATPVIPAAPTGLTASNGTFVDGVHLSWTACLNATGYNVYRNGTNTTTGATQLNAGAVTSTSYIDTTAVAGTTYYYFVIASNASGSSTYSADASGVRATLAVPGTPSNVVASKDTNVSEVQITWTGSSLASGYNVYRNTTNNPNTATKVNTSTVTTTSFNDTTAVAGTSYYYWVVAINAAGSSGYSTPDTGVRATGPTVVAESEPNNSYTTAQNIGSITIPLQLNGSLSTANDVDWYVFTLPSTTTANSSIQISFTGAAGRSWPASTATRSTADRPA